MATVCVVDPQPENYHDWASTAHADGVRLHIVPSAEAALRLADGEAIDLWIVSTQLPGLSGYELCGMLKSRSMASVYLVADEYSPEAEREAFRQRATIFGIKPAHREWLDEWRQAAACRMASHALLGH